MEVNQLQDKWGNRFKTSQSPRDGFILSLILSITAPSEEAERAVSGMAEQMAAHGRMTKSKIESAMREAVTQVNLTLPPSAALTFNGIEDVSEDLAEAIRKCITH